MGERVLMNKEGAFWVFEPHLNGSCSFIQGLVEMEFEITNNTQDEILGWVMREYNLEDLGLL